MTDRTCERCGTAPGTPYSFHYGKQTGITDFQRTPVVQPTYTGVRTSMTYHYEVGGVDTAYLCDRCLLRARARRSVRVTLREFVGVPLFAFFYVIWLIAVGNLVYLGDWTKAALLLGAGVGITAAVYAGIFAFFQVNELAEHTAIDLHREALAARGWHDFWTDKEYAKLH